MLEEQLGDVVVAELDRDVEGGNVVSEDPAVDVAAAVAARAPLWATVYLPCHVR